MDAILPSRAYSEHQVTIITHSCGVPAALEHIHRFDPRSVKMGFWKNALLVLLTAIIVAYEPRLFRNNLPIKGQGFAAPGWKKVADVFRYFVQNRSPLLLSLAPVNVNTGKPGRGISSFRWGGGEGGIRRLHPWLALWCVGSG